MKSRQRVARTSDRQWPTTAVNSHRSVRFSVKPGTVNVCSLHLNWTDQNWPATSRSSYTGHARQRHGLIGCSKTRTVGAQSVLNICIWRRLFTLEKNVSPRTGVQFSLVHVLWTSLNNFRDSCVLEPAMATERSDVEKPPDKTVCDLLPLSAKRLRANHACKADKQQSADWAECQDHVRWTPFDLWRDQCRQKSRIVAAISVPVLQQHHYSRTCVCTVLT